MTDEHCPCCSNKAFEDCCKPFLTGSKIPKTVKQTMRARFAAYRLGGCGDYLFHTWHPDYRSGLTPAVLSQKTTDWQSLEVLGFKQKGDRAAIEFRAYYKDKDGKIQCHHEISQFLRLKRIWRYTDGKVREIPVRINAQ